MLPFLTSLLLTLRVQRFLIKITTPNQFDVVEMCLSLTSYIFLIDIVVFIVIS